MLAQTFRDFELIISDNASNDSTQQIAERAARIDSRVRYVRQNSNLGAIQNFNWLVDAAFGEYFKWAACDDICAPTYLERCVATLEHNPKAVWCHTDSDQIDEHGQSIFGLLASQPAGRHAIEVNRREDGRLCRPDHPRPNATSQQVNRRFTSVLCGTTWCVDSYGVIRMETLRSTRLLQPVYGSEKVLIGELALRGTYAHVDETLFSQRVHAGAVSWDGNLAAQRRFTFGDGRRMIGGRLRLAGEHIRAVQASPVFGLERMRCYASVVKYGLQLNRWGTAIRRLFTRAGIEGDRQRIADILHEEAR